MRNSCILSKWKEDIGKYNNNSHPRIGLYSYKILNALTDLTRRIE